MSKSKIIAFYLPQYHEIPENNEWWGKGFTEWTNVKKAKPQFKGHNQPRIPLDNNYYNLMEPSTFQWQVDLAKKYGIDGFCFYHYWFNGKKLLEKPLEMYLHRPELKLDYCFSWANEPWTRSWDGQTKNVLMPQVYNGVEDIIKHFEYMLPFFKDERYIRIDNKPIYVLYRANSITYLDEMIDLWNEKAIENGFSGIYFVETLTSYSPEKYSLKTNSKMYMEPMYSLSKRNVFMRIIHTLNSPKKRNKKINYRYVWRKILKEENLSENSWGGAFVDWDNSPRKKTRNLILSHSNPKDFYKYFELIFRHGMEKKSPYIFINAWNEWAEGTYLEPDEVNQYAYLEQIKKVVENYNENY